MLLETLTSDQESELKLPCRAFQLNFARSGKVPNMKKIVEITFDPSLPESGAIARVVEFEDGSGQIQTYSRREKAWVKGGSSIQSLLTSEDLTREMLEQMNYDEEDIANILWQPEGKEGS